MPSCGGVVDVGGGEHVDALDGPLLLADSGDPSESNLSAGCDGLGDGEADGGLGALAGLESSLGGEGVAAERDASQPVDAVGGISEVAGQDSLGGGVGVGGQEGSVAIDEVSGGGAVEACGSWCDWRGSRRGTTTGAALRVSGGDDGRSGGQDKGRGLEELHFESMGFVICLKNECGSYESLIFVLKE